MIAIRVSFVLMRPSLVGLSQVSRRWIVLCTRWRVVTEEGELAESEVVEAEAAAPQTTTAAPEPAPETTET